MNSSTPRVKPGGSRPMPGSSRSSSINVNAQPTPSATPSPEPSHVLVPTPVIPAPSPGPMRPKLFIQPIRAAGATPALALSKPSLKPSLKLPGLALQIPPRGPGRAPSPAPSYNEGGNPSDHSDSEGGSSPHLLIDTSGPGASDLTIKPDSTKTVTPATVKRGASNGQPTITDLIANLKLPEISDGGSDISRLTWNDDQLEDLGRLGEGAGGSVNKVRDRQSGKIIARKV